MGFLILKDFTSVLSMNPDSRAELLAALREIYDGDYSRFFGSDGGTHSEWHGRIGLIAAVTPEIERHRRVITSMGDRFLFLRVFNRDLVLILFQNHITEYSVYSLIIDKKVLRIKFHYLK